MATTKKSLSLSERQAKLDKINEELLSLASAKKEVVQYSAADQQRISELEKEIEDLNQLKENIVELMKDQDDILISNASLMSDDERKEIEKINDQIKTARLELTKVTEKYADAEKKAAEVAKKANAQKIRILKANATRLTNSIKKEILEIERNKAIAPKQQLKVVPKKAAPKVYQHTKVTSSKPKIQAKPIPVRLNTSIGQKNGATYRHHEYEILDKELKKQLKNEEIHSVTSLTKMFGQHWDKEGGESDATIFGTTVHRLIEDLENRVFGELKEGKQVTEDEVTKRVEAILKSTKAEDLADMEGVTHHYKKGVKLNSTKDQQQQRITQITARLNEYLKLKDSLGLGNTQATSTEQSLGARIKIGDKIVNIAGTLDQIFGAMLTDLKTSESLGPEYGMQIALLQVLASINGIKVDPTGKIINMPREGDKDASVVDVTGIETEDLLKLVDIAVKMKQTNDPAEKERLHQEGCRILGIGGMSTKVSRGPKGGLLLNGKSIKEWGEYYQKNGVGHQGLGDMIRGIDSKKDRTAVVRAIKTNKEYYKDDIFEQLRTTSSMFKDYDFLSEGEYGVNIGGDKNFIQWIKAIYRMKPEDRDQYIAKMRDILSSQLAQNDDAEGMVLAMRAVNNMMEHLDGTNGGLTKFATDEIEYYRKLYDFLKSGGSVDEWKKIQKEQTGYDDLHRLDGIDIGKFKDTDSFLDDRLGAHSVDDMIAKIDSKFTSDKRIAQAMKDVRENGARRAASEWTTSAARRELEEKDWEFDARRAEIDEEEREEENGPMIDKHVDGKRMGHLFAIAVEAVSFYDQVFNQAWEQYKAEGHDDEYTRNGEKGKAAFMAANMTEQQIEQYAASKRLNDTINEIRSWAGDDWTRIMFELGGRCAEDPGLIDYIAGNDPACRRLLQNLAARYRESESIDSFSGDSDLVSTVDKQLNEGGKMKTFTETGEGALGGLVMRGLTIGPWYANPKAQAEAVESSIDDRVSRHQGTEGAGKAKKMASWRKSHAGSLGFYGDSNWDQKKDKPDHRYYAFFRYVNADGDMIGRPYLCQVDASVKIGSHIKAPTGDGSWQHGVIVALYYTTEEKIREMADDYQGEIKKFGGLYDEFAEQAEAAAVEDNSPFDVEPLKETTKSVGGGSGVDSPANLPTSREVSSETEVQAIGNIEGGGSGGTTVAGSSGTSKGKGKGKGSGKRATGSGRSGAGGSGRITITHVDSAKISADTVNIDRVEHIEQNIKNSYYGAGSAATPKGRTTSGSATATAAALGVGGKSERDLQKVQTIYNNILRIDKQIYSNEQSIASLSEDKTAKAEAYKRSLAAQNRLLLEQRNGEGKKLVEYHKAGVDLSPFGRKYATDLDVYKYGAAMKIPAGAGKSSSGGGYKFGGMGRTSWYSLDGRAFHWIERMLNGGMWLSFFNMMRKGLKTLINLSKDLDKYMTNIRIVTGTTREQAQTLTSSFIQLSQKLGVTAEEVLKAATEFYRQGYQTAEVENLVSSATKLSRLGMIDMTKSVQDITSAMKGFKLSTEQSIDVVDKLTAIDMKAAVSAGEIAEGLAQFANLANVNGVDLDQAAAYVATIAEVTQKGGSATGSALKMIMSRYGNVKAGAYNKLNIDTENTDTSQDLNDVEKVLKKLGISVRDANLNFKDFDVILDEIAERWNDLDNVTKRAIATSFAGTRQQEQFLTLMENYDKYKKLLDVSRNSAGTADKKYESYLESYEAAKNELQNAVKELANNAQINKILTDVTKSITKVFKTFIPWLMRQLPWLMHLLLDVRTMMGKSVIQKTGTKLVDFARGGGFWQGIPGLRSRARVPSTGVYTTGGPTGSGYATSAGGIPLVYTYNGGSVSATGNYSVGSGSDYSTSYLTGSGATSDSYAIATGDNLTYNTTTGGTDISSKSIKSTGAKMGGGSAVSGILFAVSMFTNMIASAITAFKTSGVTHKNAEGETVESSENAQKAAGSTAAMLAMIPFGIGSMVDSLFGISEGIAAQIDAEKDAAATATKNAEKVISSLNSMDNKLDQIANYGIGSDAFNKALNEMLVDLYSDDNKESREALEKVLGGPGELRNNINRIKTGSEQEAKAALRELKLAELEAKKEKIQDKYATQRYNNAAEISKKLSAVNDYKGENHGWIWAKDIGIGVGGGAATGAIAGAAIGSVVPVIGTAIGAVAGAIIGGIAGLIGGIFAGKKETDALKEEDKKKYERETAWGRMSMSQKILDTQERIDKALEDGNGEYAGKLQDLLDALNTQNALSNQIIDELNDISLEQAYIGAVYKDDRGNEIALQDMSVAQLKNLGVDKILEIYGQAAIDSGLIGQSLFDDNGKLTDSAYNYLLPKLRSQDDDEIRSVLSGEAYTLKEALALKDQFPDSIYVDRLLQSFALSLNTTTDGLADLSDALGSLSLAETYMSTTELSDRLNSYTGLLDSISTGAGNTSEWMNTIINQFPELIAYMGDTSTLFDKIGEKVGALSEQYINAQYAAVSSSADTYNAIKKDFYNKIGDSGITALLDKANVTSIEGVTEFLRTQYGADGKLTEIGETVKNALAETVDEFGMSITSSVLKGYYDKVIEFKTKVLDAQIKNLNEQKEALQNINKQREYENQLIEAKLKLENASKEKRRVYRAGVGWVYEADQGAIAKAQTEYDQLQNQKTVSDLEMQIATLESEKNRLTSIYDEQNYETLSDFYTSYMKKTDDSLSLYSNMADGITGISSSVSELVDKTVNADKENREKAISAAQKAWQDLQRSSPGSADYNNKLEAYHNAYSAAVNAGMTQDDTANWGKTDIAGKGSQGAWDVGAGDVNKQKVAPSLHFKLADPSDSGKSFEGVVDMGVTQYDSQIHEWILNDLKNGKAFVWTKGSGGVNPKNDARFKYDGDSSLTNYIKRLKDLGVSEFVITGWDGGQESVYVKDGVPYAIRGWNAADDPNGLSRIKGAVGTELWAQQLDAQNMPNAKYARGTLGVSLINELGTEAIVTPQGTITALPSHTGVVPADITKNLWELGKVAPSILRTLELQLRDISVSANGIGGTDESFNVGTINMTVNADGTFDADAFVESVKMRASLTRNTNR